MTEVFRRERRGSPPFQLRLSAEFRSKMEDARRQDGDESLGTWIKRIIREELKSRGVDVGE